MQRTEAGLPRSTPLRLKTKGQIGQRCGDASDREQVECSELLERRGKNMGADGGRDRARFPTEGKEDYAASCVTAMSLAPATSQMDRVRRRRSASAAWAEMGMLPSGGDPPSR